MHAFWSDVRYALRTMRMNPGFTVVAILTLALGIGANTSIFTVLNATVLRSLPYPESDRLMLPQLLGGPPNEERSAFPWSYPKFRTFRELDQDFDALAGFNAEDMNLVGSGDPDRVRVEAVSGTYFSILGVESLVGRTLSPFDDEVPGRDAVAVVSESLWRHRFGGSPDVLGKTIKLNDVVLTIVGVVPPRFEGLSGQVDVWVPMMMVPKLAYPEALDERWSHWFEVVGRLKDGATVEQAIANMAVTGERIDEAHPGPFGGDRWSATAMRLSDARNDPGMRHSLWVLLGAVGFVLLIACANVANLLLARAAGRQKEVAIRAAVGARRTRMIRQLLTESVVLALAGGMVATVATLWTTRLLSTITPERTGSWGIEAVELLDLRNIGVDLRVLLFSLGLSIATGIMFGLIPAIWASRGDLSSLLRGSRDYLITSGPGGRWSARMSLVALEIALALTLLIGAGLMLRSFARLMSVSPGFDPESIVTFRIDPSPNRYDRRTAPDLHRAIAERLAAIPGVEGVAINKCTPLSSACNGSVVMGADDREFPPDVGPQIGVHFVNPDYFLTLRIPLLQGRAFDDRDRPDSPHVAILNRAAADMLWPGGAAVGRSIVVGMGYFFQGEETIPAEVVGVVEDVRYDELEAAATPAIYVPGFAYASPSASVMVRTSRDPLSLVGDFRRAILQIDGEVPIFDVRSMEDRVGDASSRSRFAAALLAIFAGVAALLAIVGIYGVVSLAVRERTRELGIRMALGARASDIVGDVVRRLSVVAGAGAIAGVVGALALTRFLGSLLYEVTPRDPLTFAGITALLVAAAIVASWIPARRASRIDPSRALREE